MSESLKGEPMVGVVISFGVQTDDAAVVRKAIKRVTEAIRLGVDELPVDNMNVITIPDIHRPHESGPTPRTARSFVERADAGHG